MGSVECERAGRERDGGRETARAHRSIYPQSTGSSAAFGTAHLSFKAACVPQHLIAPCTSFLFTPQPYPDSIVEQVHKPSNHDHRSSYYYNAENTVVLGGVHVSAT